MTSKTCACGSGRAYADCCRPFHRGEREASTPEALMRSRFSAYALGEAEYLWRRLDDHHPDRQAPKDKVVRALKHSSATYKYMRLRIFKAEGDQVSNPCNCIRSSLLILHRITHIQSHMSIMGRFSAIYRKRAGYPLDPSPSFSVFR